MRNYKIINKILTTAIVILLIYLATNYLLNFFLPQKIMSAVEKFSRESLDNRIAVGRINVGIIRGVSLNEVSLYKKEAKVPYIKIKKIRAIPDYPALISTKKLVISLRANGAQFILKRAGNGEFVLPEFKPQPKPSAIKEGPAMPQAAAGKKSLPQEPLFLVSNISVKKLTLNVEDDIAGFTKKFPDISIRANLKRFPQIDFIAGWQDKISLTGIYRADTNSVGAACKLQKIMLADFNSYFKQFSFKGGSIDTAQFTLEVKDNYLIKGNVKLKNVLLSYPLNKLGAKNEGYTELKGDFDLGAELKIANPVIEDISNDTGRNFSYRIDGSLTQGQIHNLLPISDLQHINANFSLDNDKFELSHLAADFPLAGQAHANQKIQTAIHLKVKGEISLNDSQFYCEVTTSSGLRQFIDAAKAIKQFNFKYEEKGDISLKAIAKGNLNQRTLDYYVEYHVLGARFKEASDINLSGFLKTDKLNLEECSFVYKNMPIKLRGQLENFADPLLTLNLDSDRINLALKAKYAKDIIAIEALTLKVADSKIAAQGTITNGAEKYGKLRGLAQIDLKDIKMVMDLFNLKYPTFLEKASPQGMLEAKFIVEGQDDIRKVQLKLAGLSDKIKIYGLTAEQMQIELYRDKNELIISPLIAGVCDGTLTLRLKIDSLNNKTVLNVIANDLDLSELRKEMSLKDKNLSGLLSLDINLQNDGLSQWNKMAGNGKVVIKEGNIWEINFLKGLGQFLFIPEFESIVFEEGYSDLLFKGENVIFENTELKSPKMTLRGQGRISLKGDLDFILVSEFNPNLISSSESLNKIITGILSQNTLAIELGGTLQKPTYKIKPVAFSNFEAIKGLLEGILK